MRRQNMGGNLDVSHQMLIKSRAKLNELTLPLAFLEQRCEKVTLI
jgi:BMFP domain-containing protein YqiC